MKLAMVPRMRVFLLRGDPQAAWLVPADTFDWAGVSIGSMGRAAERSWPVPALRPEGGADLRADAWRLNAAVDGPVLGVRSRARLADLCAGCAALRPVRVAERSGWWLDVWAMVDALAPETEGDRVDDFLAAARRLVFRAGRVEMAPALFRVPELPAGYLFARDAVAEAARGLVGLRIDLIWSEAAGGVLDPPGFW